MPENPKEIQISDPALASYLKLRQQGTLGTEQKEVGLVAPTHGESQFDTEATIPTVLEGGLEDFRGERQSRTDKIFNAVPRLLGKVGTEVAKTPGYLYALGEAGLTEKTLAESLDNTWLNTLEKADQAVKDEFAIYKPKSVREGNLWDNLTSASFWTDEGVDGAGFLISMIAPGAALKATGIAGKLAKLPMLSKLGAANIELGQATLLNTALESAAETKGVVDDLNKQFEAKIANGEINPTTGNVWTPEEAKQAVGDAAVNTFQMNMGLLIVPNMIMNKNLLGRFNGSKRVLDEFKDATGKFVSTNPIVKKSLIKEYAKSIGSSILSEGFMEEAGQTTIENYNKKVATGDNTADLASEYINTLTSVEGQKAILLGAVMGGMGSVRGTKQELKGEAQQRAVLSNLIKNNFEGFSVAMDNVLEKDEQGNIIIDPTTNKPKVNNQEAANVISNLVKEQQSTNLQDLSALENNKDMYDYIFNQQLTRFALPYLNVEGGTEVLEQHINDLSKNITNTGSNQLEENEVKIQVKQQIKDLSKINESLSESIYSLPLEQLSQDTKLVGKFANKLFNTAYQESSKQLFLTKKIDELNKELLTLHDEAAGVSQFTIEREKIVNRINSLNNSLEISKQNYNSVFDENQIKQAFNDFAGNITQEEDAILEAEQQEEVKSTQPVTPMEGEPLDITGDISDDQDTGDTSTQTTKQPSVDEFVSRIYNGEQPSTDEDIQFLQNNIEEIEAKLKIKKENTAKLDNVDFVSESLSVNSSTTKAAEDQIIQSPKEVSQGMYSDISKGISSMANVVMMKLFGNNFKGGTFKFDRTKDGVPELDNKSNINIEALNEIQVGDEISFELVTLEGKNLQDYNKSKEESIKHINHNVSSMGNSYNYSTNDTSYGFDDKHIAIKSKGELIGFVQQPHAISNEVKDESKQSYIDARNSVLAQRKAILDGLSKGPVTTKIKSKGAGNLYTKLTETGKIDLVNDLFTTPRPQDLTPSGRLVFVFNDGVKLELPPMDDSDMESDIKARLSELGNWGSKGSVYQLIKDTTGNWYPIPVYSNQINTNTESTKGVLKALKGLSDTSLWSDVVNALNPFIYSSTDESKNASITIIDKGGIKLKVDGKEFTIDALNKGIGLSEFKSAIGTKQQNISTKNINSKYTQDNPNGTGLKQRNTLGSNATLFKGEYLVQPFLSYEPIGVSEQQEEYLEANATGSTSLQLNDSSEGESLLDKAIRLKGEDNDPGFSRNEFGDLAANRKEFDKWLNKNLPGLTLSDVQDLKELKVNITDAIGAYRNMVIYLFQGATNKTAYHEAFHGVFRNLLSNEQRFELLEEAINKYEAPTEANLDYLQEGLNEKASREQLTALWYEEKLADDFAQVTADIKPITSFKDKIKAFFNKILNFFDIFTLNKQSKIDKLFNNINEGKLAKKSTVSKKNNLAIINKELKSTNFGSLAFARSDKFTATVKWDRTKSIGDSFMNTYQSLKSQGQEKISGENIFKMIYNKYKRLNPGPTETKKLLENNLEEYKKIQEELSKMSAGELKTLGKITEPENFNFLKKEAIKYLEVYGLKVTDTEINYEETTLLEENNVEGDNEITSLASQTTKGLSDWVSQAGLKSASVRLKMFLSSIPVTNDGIVQSDNYGFTKFHDFNQLYYFLERSLTGLNTFEDMLKELNSLSDVRPEVSVVIDKLTKPDTFTSPEELTKLQNDFKSNFNKQQLTYSLIKFDTDSKTGGVSYKIFDANRMSIGVTTSDNWKSNLTSNTKNTIVETRGDELVTTGTDKAIRVKEQYSNLSKQVTEGTAKYEVINKLLTKVGIEFSPEVLKVLLTNGSKKLDFNIKQVLDYHANTEPTAKDIQNYDVAFKELVKLETSGVLLSYTQSFNNVENSNIYTIQLPSYASKLLDDLTSRDFNKFDARLQDLLKDPFYKYSNLLEELQTNNDFRISKFRMSYLDGLKDFKGSKKGSKFTNMSPKDFMSMQIALFQNSNANQNKVLKDKTGKYIYITPADKSMAMIFDSKVYNATLTNGDITIDTPIVNQFYNVLLSEVARIKQQLEIKSKVESGELTEKDLLVHYHYKPKSDMLAFDGFAYQIMNFGEDFNTKFNKRIVDSLGNSEDVESALFKIEQDIKLELVEQLKKDFKATLNEAVEKGVISETSRGVYKSNSIDAKVTTDVKQTLADFSLNTWLNNIEMSNLLNGDVALYKAKDLQKRTYQSGAMGVNINSQGHPIARTKVVKDFTTQSEMSIFENEMLSQGKSEESINNILNTYGHITKSQNLILNDPNISDVVKKELLKQIKDNNVTDAQVLVSPEFYKAIMVGRGTWNEKMQTAYDIAEGIIENPTSQQLKDARLQLSNIKPFYFGNRFDKTLGIQRFEQVKCAMLPLFKSYVKTNPLLASKRDEMDTDTLDMIAFESSFKAAIGYRSDVNSNESPILELDMNNFMVQVDNPAHILDEENDSIRQLKMLILGNIDPNTTYNGKSGKDIISDINDLEGYNLTESLNHLVKLINGKQSGEFKEYMKEMLTKRNATDNIMEALNIIGDEFEYALDSGSSSVQVENLISSLFTNKVIKQAFEGGSGVQASSIGMKYNKDNSNYKEVYQGSKSNNFDDREFNYFTTNKKEASNYGSNIRKVNIDTTNYLKGYSKEELDLRSQFNNEFNKSFDILDNSKEGLITQEEYFKYIKSKGFKGIDFTRENGEDNMYLITFDKVTNMNELDALQSDLKYFKSEDGNTFWSEAIMPAWSKKFFNEDGTHKDNIPDNLKELLFYRIPTEGFHSMMSIRVKSFLPVEYGNTILMPYEVTSQFGADFDFDKVYFLSPEFDSNLQKITYDESKSIAENDRSARNNKVLDNYLKILSSKEILPLILNPSGFDKILKFKEAIDKKDNIQPKKLSFFSSVTQRDYKTRNHTGMGLKGQFALHVSGHSYATLLQLTTGETSIGFNNINSNNLSNLYDINGNLISKEVSSIMAAVLDDIKNPIIQAIGINQFTADVWATIVRAGFSVETAINFTTQPVIVELSEKLAENDYKIKAKGTRRNSGKTLLKDYEKRFNDVYEFLNKEQEELLKTEVDSVTDADMEFFRHWKAVNVNKLNPDEGRNPEDKAKHNFELAKYYQFQLNVLNAYNDYDKIAKDLVKINRLFGVNKEVGPNFEDIVNKKYLLDEIEAPGFSIGGLNRETLSTIKPLSAAYDAQIEALDYLSKYFPYDSNVYNKVKTDYIGTNVKFNAGKESLSKIDTKTRMLMNGFIRNYIDYKSPNFESLNNKESKETLFTVLPSLLDAIKSSDNDSKFFNGALRKNVFIDNLKVTMDEKSGLSFITIKANRMDIQLKNNISESIKSLFDNKDTRPLIENLINYSFVATGFHTGLRSFHDLIPPIIFKELGYSDYRKSITTSLNLDNYEMTDSESKRIIDQMIRNFPSEFTKAFDTETFNKQGVNLVTNLNLVKQSGRGEEIITNYNDVLDKQHYPVYVQYLRVYDEVAKKSILYKLDNGVYKPISRLGKAGGMIEINTLEDIKESLNKENNLDSKVINDTFADETSTNETIAEPAFKDVELNEVSDMFGEVMDENQIKEQLKSINPEEGTNEIPKDC